MKFLASDIVLFRVQSMAGKFSFLGKNKIHHIEEKRPDRTLRGKCAFYREKKVYIKYCCIPPEDHPNVSLRMQELEIYLLFGVNENIIFHLKKDASSTHAKKSFLGS